MNIENIIKQKAVQLKSSRRNIDIAPDLCMDLIEKWKKKYCKDLDEDISDYILVMSYTKTGNFVLTGNAMYYDNYLQNGIEWVKFSDITGVEAKVGGLFTVDKLFLSTRDGGTIQLDGCIDGIDVNKFAQILMYIVKNAEENGQDFTVSRQGVMSYELSDDLKVLYFKVLCNYSYLNDQFIDAEEYNAIGRFSVRMELDSSGRKELRRYMNLVGGREKTGLLLKKIKIQVADNSGEWDALRYCLLQDVLSIHNIQNRNIPWREDGFIGSLMEACELCPEQIDTMCKAVSLNEKMQMKNADMRELRKEWDRLIREIRYSTSYVPSSFLFCSGSVYGIASCNNFLSKDNLTEKEINKQRELILHEIIINNQKTLNVLIDDMNYLAEQLESAVNESYENKERYKKLIMRLKMANSGLETENKEREEEEKIYIEKETDDKGRVYD